MEEEGIDCWLLHWPGLGRHLNQPPVTRTDILREGGKDGEIQYSATKAFNKNPEKVVQYPEY